MFLFKFFLVIIGGVCRLLLIIGLGCYMFTVGIGGAESTFGEVDRERAEAFLSASYDIAADQIDRSWHELRKYRVIVVKEEV